MCVCVCVRWRISCSVQLQTTSATEFSTGTGHPEGVYHTFSYYPQIKRHNVAVCS
jgi:hypothetical protein